METFESGRIKVILEGFDAIGTTKYVSRVIKRHQAELLSNLETMLDRDSTEFYQIRKLILDSTNDMGRDIVKNIFGEISV